MTANIVGDYRENQIHLIEKNIPDIQRRGFIRDYSDLYPDIKLDTTSIGYSRTGNPLLFSLLMYDKSAVLIPPLSKQALDNRFSLNSDILHGLIQAGIIQPIILEPSGYNQPHLLPLINKAELNAPSVWVRGLAALETLGLQDALNEEACPIPVAQMAKEGILVSRFRTRYPSLSDEELHSLIKQDLMVNYADLCIFGKGAEAIAVLSRLPTMKEKVEWLYKFNEIQTYPHLFGFNGTANYGAATLVSDAEVIPARLPKAALSPFNDERELELFLTGIGLTVPQLSATTIIEFHASGDGKRLRSAVEYFEGKARRSASHSDFAQLSKGDMIDAQERLKTELINATKLLSRPKFIRNTRRVDKAVQFTLQCGGLAAGAWLGALAPGMPIVGGLIGAGIGAKLVETVILPVISETVREKARRLFMNPGLANLWGIQQKVRKKSE